MFNNYSAKLWCEKQTMVYDKDYSTIEEHHVLNLPDSKIFQGCRACGCCGWWAQISGGYDQWRFGPLVICCIYRIRLPRYILVGMISEATTRIPQPVPISISWHVSQGVWTLLNCHRNVRCESNKYPIQWKEIGALVQKSCSSMTLEEQPVLLD